MARDAPACHPEMIPETHLRPHNTPNNKILQLLTSSTSFFFAYSEKYERKIS